MWQDRKSVLQKWICQVPGIKNFKMVWSQIEWADFGWSCSGRNQETRAAGAPGHQIWRAGCNTLGNPWGIHCASSEAVTRRGGARGCLITWTCLPALGTGRMSVVKEKQGLKQSQKLPEACNYFSHQTYKIVHGVFSFHSCWVKMEVLSRQE